MKGKIVMINDKKIDPDKSLQVQNSHKDRTESQSYHAGYIKSMKFQGGLKVRANQ